MALVIDKSNYKKIVELLSAKLKKKSTKGNLNNHFGKLKRNIDGLKYQLKIRENEN